MSQKSLSPSGHFQWPLALSLNDNDSTVQRILKSPVDMTIIRAMLSGSQSVNKLEATLINDG